MVGLASHEGVVRRPYTKVRGRDPLLVELHKIHCFYERANV